MSKRLLELLIFNKEISIPVPYSKKNSILLFQVKIHIETVLFIIKSLNNWSPSAFNTWFSFFSDQHNYETWSSTQGNLIKLFHKTKRYGKYSITVGAVESRNKILKQFKDLLLRDLSPIKLKKLSVIFILNHINNSLIMQILYLILIRGIIAVIIYTC